MTVYTLFRQPASPASIASDGGAYTLAMQFTLSQDAPLTGIWFYSAPGAGALPTACGIFRVTSPGAGSVVSGTSNLSPAWSGAAGSGWVKCAYNGSVTLTAATAYKTAVSYGPAGSINWYSATSHYWDTGAGGSGLTNGIITAPNNAGGDGGQDTLATAAGLVYPATSFNATSYWVDVELTLGSAAPAPATGSAVAAFMTAM